MDDREREEGGYLTLADGIVLFDDKPVGEFVVHEYPVEHIIATMTDGRKIVDLLEYANEHGMPVQLLITPQEQE